MHESMEDAELCAASQTISRQSLDDAHLFSNGDEDAHQFQLSAHLPLIPTVTESSEQGFGRLDDDG